MMSLPTKVYQFKKTNDIFGKFDPYDIADIYSN